MFRLFLLAFLIGGAVIFGKFVAPDLFQPSTSQVAAKAGSPEKFEYLTGQTSNSCSLQAPTLESYSDTTSLQGSCCSRMDFHRYQEQVEGLKQYSGISQIPSDPYDISASLAKELLGYQKDIDLTAEQQAAYDEAMKLSHEGGPCCCKCWRWDAFEGQAKYLITEYNFTSEQVASVWDIEDGCGGSGHEHG